MSDERDKSDDSTRFAAGRGADDETRFTGVGSAPATGGKPDATFPPGSVIGHTYRIEAFLARGGMGEVYRASHVELNTEHAIKIILPELANNQRIVDLFRREASVLRNVRHDAVVAYDGVFRDENARLYLVMEFADGPSLSKLMRERPLDADEVRQLRDRLADGLAVAHDKGVVHRDISPDNVILPGGDLGKAKIIDFGISKAVDPEVKTIIGDDFAGKFSYVSPEQLGMFGGQIDGRSDIYSLGLVLAAAALGEPLDMGLSPISVIEARRTVPDLSRVPAAVRADLAAMLQPDPAKRPQTMRELIRTPEQRGGRRSALSDTSRQGAAAKPGSGRTGLIVGALAVIVVAGGALGYWYWQGRAGRDHVTGTTQADNGVQQTGTNAALNSGAADTSSTVGQGAQQSTASTTATQTQTSTPGQGTETGATGTQQQATATGTTSPSTGATTVDSGQASATNSTSSGGDQSAAAIQNGTAGAAAGDGQSHQDNASTTAVPTATSQAAGADSGQQQASSNGSASTATSVANGQQSSSPAVTSDAGDQSATKTAANVETTTTQVTGDAASNVAASNTTAVATDSGGSAAAGAAATGTQTALLPQVPDVAKLRKDAAGAVQGLSCAGVRVDVSDAGRIAASGYVASDADRAATAARLAALATGGEVHGSVAVIVPPLCEVLDLLRTQTVFDQGTPAINLLSIKTTVDHGRPVFDSGRAAGVYRKGDHIEVVVTAPATSDGYLYVDSVEAEGRTVIHLLPNGMRGINRVKAGQQVVIGNESKEFKTYEINADPTNNIFIAVFSRTPLYEDVRPLQEGIETYLPLLDRSLRAAAQDGTNGVLSAYMHVVFNPN